MDSDKIILTKDIIRVLSSETRIKILKKVAERRMTISELSRDLNIAKSTVHEHLALLTAVDFIIPVSDGHQWKYYEITSKGKSLLTPEGTITVTILLTSAGFLFVILAFAFFVTSWLSWTHQTIKAPVYGAGYSGHTYFDLFPVGIGIVMLFVGVLFFIRLFRLRASIKKRD